MAGRISMSDCGLCVAYNEDYRVIFRNDDAVSVVITNPINAGHLMIMPRRHVLKLGDLTMNESLAVNEILNESQQRLAQRFPDTPPIIGINYGRHSTQPHIHYQIFPSDTHVRVLYAAAHLPGELKAQSLNVALVRPVYSEDQLSAIARSLR